MLKAVLEDDAEQTDDRREDDGGFHGEAVSPDRKRIVPQGVFKRVHVTKRFWLLGRHAREGGLDTREDG